ncbi:transmembrane protein -like [Brachionus plicatilis]|uniref:Transmembrane protein-like n=1 Tax=Brachionus plicatilis TaxID=10195 RepID=A0A3M7RDG4_BRAPC|nr:transmembrane protein -like [Brachionus plicatilis]
MKSIYSDYGVSIKLRLYSMQKHQILVVFLCFFSAFFLTTTIGIFGPEMLTTIASNLTRAEISKPSAIIFESPNLGKFHQQLWLTGQPIIHGRKEEFVKQFTLSIRHLTTKNQHLEFLNRSRNIHCKNERQADFA